MSSKVRVIRITSDHGSTVERVDNDKEVRQSVLGALDGYLVADADPEFWTSFVVEFDEMTLEEFDALPEWDGV